MGASCPVYMVKLTKFKLTIKLFYPLNLQTNIKQVILFSAADKMLPAGSNSDFQLNGLEDDPHNGTYRHN